MKRVLLAVLDDGVTSIGSTIVSGAYIVLLAQKIDELALALVSPLASHHHGQLRPQPIDAARDRHAKLRYIDDSVITELSRI